MKLNRVVLFIFCIGTYPCLQPITHDYYALCNQKNDHSSQWVTILASTTLSILFSWIGYKFLGTHAQKKDVADLQKKQKNLYTQQELLKESLKKKIDDTAHNLIKAEHQYQLLKAKIVRLEQEIKNETIKNKKIVETVERLVNSYDTQLKKIVNLFSQEK